MGGTLLARCHAISLLHGPDSIDGRKNTAPPPPHTHNITTVLCTPARSAQQEASISPSKRSPTPEQPTEISQEGIYGYVPADSGGSAARSGAFYGFIALFAYLMLTNMFSQRIEMKSDPCVICNYLKFLYHVFHLS